MDSKSSVYLEKVKKALHAEASPVDSVPMSKYMRDQFPFLGIKAPRRNEISREFLQRSTRPPYNKLEEVIPGLWNLSEREFQYFTIALLEKYKKDFSPDILLLIEFILVEKSWWDTVDPIASKLAGHLFYICPELRKPVVERWLSSGNIWLERSTVLFWIKYKKDTDWDFLAETIKRLRDSDEFFIQKALGWILREYSKVEPTRVRQFIAETKLPGLTVREGLKFLQRQ